KEREVVLQHTRTMRDRPAVPDLERVERRIVSVAGAHAGRRIEAELIEVAALARSRVVDLDHARSARHRAQRAEQLAREAVPDSWRTVTRLADLRLEREDVGMTERDAARVRREL